MAADKKPWLLLGAVGVAITLVSLLFGLTNLPRQTVFMLGIFALATLLWSTEALPLFATALLVIGLELLLLANPGQWPGLGFQEGASPSFGEIFAAAANPVLVLFLGGFLLARAAIKTGLDRAMSGWLLQPFGERPRGVLLGVMLVTATFSMWMSNTATTAMMMALTVPLLAQIPRGDRFRAGLILAVPISANIGGIGTPISSPPNAVALGYLQKAGQPLAFLEWMLVSVPLMFGMLGFAWLVLWYSFRPLTPGLRLRQEQRKISRSGRWVTAIFSVTVAFWVTDQWHGLPAAMVAMLPAVALTASGILDRQDVNHLDWHILILIAGGIALGHGMQISGTGNWLAGTLQQYNGSPLLITTLLVFLTLGLGTFMSNTAAANLLLPIGVAAGISLSGPTMGGTMTQFALSIALAASMSMMLPVSTPPNAIAYAQGEFTTGQMARIGAVIGLVAGVQIILFCGPVLRFWGIIEQE